MIWSHDSLWQKAKLFIGRALAEDRSGQLFPLWAAFALEALARAALAKVHPVLVADPQDGSNILYACGFPVERPKSVPAKTVFIRCKTVVPNFTDEEFKVCTSLTEARNEELHSGASTFAVYETRLWLANYFRVCKVLLLSMDLSLEDFLGKEEAAAADTMIVASTEIKKADVLKAIGSTRKSFEKLDDGEKDSRRRQARGFAASQGRVDRRLKVVPCPACGSDGVITGQEVALGAPRAQEESIVQDVVMLPTHFTCKACGLELNDHGALHAAGFGGQYSVGEAYDPVDFYGLMPPDAYEEEYQNE